jgi:hypothetical protein
MTWHMAMCGRGSEGATGEWSGYPPSLVRSQSIASPAQYKCYQLTPTPQLPVVDGTVAPAESHGFIRFAERQNLVSALVPSNLNCSMQSTLRNILEDLNVQQHRCENLKFCMMVPFFLG